MNTLEIQTVLAQGKTTTDEALRLFDQLDTVELEFMFGQWRGSGLHTNHQLDGILEVIGWYGKEFIDPETVHPLLFSDGNDLFKVDPNPIITNMGLRFPIPPNKAIKPLYNATCKMLKTEESKARIRLIQYRDRLTTAMFYDYLPMIDVFRKVDQNTVLGLMDGKGMPQPFFFILKRDL